MNGTEPTLWTLRTVELAGSRRAMGEAFGEQFRDDVRGLTDARIAALLAFVHRHSPGRALSREQALAIAGRTAEAHRRFDPPVWEEFHGIARGAGLTIEELLIGNGFTDFRDFALFESGAPDEPVDDHLGECTAFLVPGVRADGHPIVGQTWDMNFDARHYLVVVRRKPDDAPETLGLTTTGCLCLIGMNAEGVSVGNTNLVPTDSRVGVNYLFTITRALGCASAAEAAAAIEATPRLSGHNYYVADERKAINIEATARRSERTVVDREPFVHANHHLVESLKPLEFDGQDLSSSLRRQAGLERAFAELDGSVSMDDCWQALGGITQGDDAIANPDYTGTATLATVVQCPARRLLHVCAGGPRTGRKQVFTL